VWVGRPSFAMMENGSAAAAGKKRKRKKARKARDIATEDTQTPDGTRRCRDTVPFELNLPLATLAHQRQGRPGCGALGGNTQEHKQTKLWGGLGRDALPMALLSSDSAGHATAVFVNAGHKDVPPAADARAPIHTPVPAWVGSLSGGRAKKKNKRRVRKNYLKSGKELQTESSLGRRCQQVTSRESAGCSTAPQGHGYRPEEAIVLGSSSEEEEEPPLANGSARTGKIHRRKKKVRMQTWQFFSPFVCCAILATFLYVMNSLYAQGCCS